MKQGCYGIQVADDDLEVLKSIYGPEQGYSGKYKDDLTGQLLKDELVLKARRVELEYFNSKGVWRKVPRHNARAATGRPPVSVRWVDTNKGDEVHPNYRSRLVARQLKAMDQSGQSFFAPAPPLEALRTVLSLAMTSIETAQTRVVPGLRAGTAGAAGTAGSAGAAGAAGAHRPDWDPRSPNRRSV